MKYLAVLLLVFSGVACTASQRKPIPDIAVIEQASETAYVMTLPIKEDTSVCFPQEFVKVRMHNGVVLVDDVLAYPTRKLWISEGLIECAIDGKNHFIVGFIDAHGNFVIKPTFDSVLAFSDGVAVVAVDERYGYIKKDGSWLCEPKFSWAYSFEDGYASAELDGQFGILNHLGEWHLQPQFERLDPLGGGLFAVRPNGEEGFFDPETLKFIQHGELGEYYTRTGTE